MRRIIFLAAVAMAVSVRGDEPAEWLQRIESLSVRPTPLTDWWTPEQLGVGYRVRPGSNIAASLGNPAKSLLDPNIIPIELRD